MIPVSYTHLVSYVPCTVLADGVPVVIELEEKDQFKLTPEKLLEKITDKTKILIMPFPNNPTGAIMEKSDVETVSYTHLRENRPMRCFLPDGFPMMRSGG